MPFNGGLLAMTKKSQVEKFREAAREVGTDQSEERFNEALKDLAKRPRDESSDPEKLKH